ncbi:immunity 53 family protein [Streptomyces sp. NPDC001514]
MTDAGSVLGWLQGWYAEQCDGDWEHEWGVKIETLDNPGWYITVDLEGTPLAGRVWPESVVRRDCDDWIFARVRDRRFDASCGPGNLTEVLTMFQAWATKAE